MALYNIDKVKTNQAAFAAKVIDIAGKLGTDPDYLMKAMTVESSLNPAAVNPKTGATGLIQFMPGTAAALGTSTAALKTMSNLDQLDFVYKYFFPYRSKLKTLGDVYLTVFYPAAVGKADFKFPDIVMKQNPTFAKFLINGALTKASIENYLAAKFPTAAKVIDAAKNISPLLLILFFVGIIILLAQ